MKKITNKLKFKKLKKGEITSLIILVVLTIVVGYMGVSKKFLNKSDLDQNNTILTNNVESKGYITYDNKDDDYTYSSGDNHATVYENEIIYKDYYVPISNYKSSTSNNYYADKEPSVEYTTTEIIYTNIPYDVYENIKVWSSYYGDNITLKTTYNNIDIATPGDYLVVYKACTPVGKCRTFQREYIVKTKNSTYNKTAKWSNYSKLTCEYGDTSCTTYNIKKPTAVDPYTNEKLSVYLVSGDVNIYSPNTYTLIYATNKYGDASTIARIVTVEQQTSYNSSNSDAYKQSYTDITNYQWQNRVTYTYRCDNVGMSGESGWTYVSTDASNGSYTNNADNHPTYFYNQNGYSGTLYKQDAYCIAGCSPNMPELSVCNVLGQKKQITKTFVGIYSGRVYRNY